MNKGLPLAITCPTDIKLEWLTTKLKDEKLVSAITQSEAASMTWDELIVPSPMEYFNRILYYIGHLDDDHIVSGHITSENDDDTESTASDLARKLKHQTLRGVREHCFWE